MSGEGSEGQEALSTADLEIGATACAFLTAQGGKTANLLRANSERLPHRRWSARPTAGGRWSLQ